MATHNLNAKLIMRNDTPQAWRTADPILGKGEVGCAIDSDTGVVTIKVGDGVHHWCDLEMRLGTKEHSTTYATAKGYSTLHNMPIKPSGHGHAEGQASYASGNYSHAEGYQTKLSSLQNSVDEMQEAMRRLQRTASAAGVSMTEAVNALKNIYIVPGNEKPVKVAFEDAPCSTQQVLVTMAQVAKEEKEQEKQISQSDESRLYKDFEIPHYDIEMTDISTSIDF